MDLLENNQIDFEMGDLFSDKSIRSISSKDPDSTGLWWVLSDILDKLNAAKSLMPSIMAKKLGKDIAIKLMLSMESGAKGIWCVNQTGVYMIIFALRTKQAQRLQRKIADSIVSGAAQRSRNSLETTHNKHNEEILKLNELLDSYEIVKDASVGMIRMTEKCNDYLTILNRAIIDRADEKVAIAEDAIDVITRVFEKDYDDQDEGKVARFKERERIAILTAKKNKKDLEELQESVGIKEKHEEYKNMSTMRQMLYVADKVNVDFHIFSLVLTELGYLKGSSKYRRTFTNKATKKIVINNSGDLYIKHSLIRDVARDINVLIANQTAAKIPDNMTAEFQPKRYVNTFKEFQLLLCENDDQGGIKAPTNEESLKHFIRRNNFKTEKEAEDSFKAWELKIKKDAELQLSRHYVHHKILVADDGTLDHMALKEEMRDKAIAKIESLTRLNAQERCTALDEIHPQQPKKTGA